MKDIHDVLIIGGGPAGMTAGIYAVRAGLSALILEGGVVGGQAVNAHSIENYPGFATGVSGYELAYAMQTQCQRLGVKFIYEQAVSAELTDDIKTVRTSLNEYSAKNVIIATGAKPRLLGVENEQSFVGAGLSYCATCDGGFFKGKVVAVIGGGDTAVTDAIYLSRIAKSVHIIHRRDAFRAGKLEVERMLALENVHPVYNSVVQSLMGDQSLSGLMLRNVQSGAISQIEVDGAFVAVGNEPQTDIFTGLKLESGYILCDGVHTGIKGIYAAGDVCRGAQKQVVTACAAGAAAAITISESIGQ